MGRYRIEVTLEVTDEAALRDVAARRQIQMANDAEGMESLTLDQEGGILDNQQRLSIPMLLVGFIGQEVTAQLGPALDRPVRFIDVDDRQWISVIDLDDDSRSIRLPSKPPPRTS